MQAAACSSACARSTLLRSLMIIDRSCVSLRLSLRGLSVILVLLADSRLVPVEVCPAQAAHQLGHLDLVQTRQQPQLLIVVIIKRGGDLAGHGRLSVSASAACAARR